MVLFGRLLQLGPRQVSVGWFTRLSNRSRHGQKLERVGWKEETWQSLYAGTLRLRALSKKNPALSKKKERGRSRR